MDHISTKELESLLADQMEESTPRMKIPDLPCHTQAVEKHVKMVTEASESMSSAKERDGNIGQKIQSRKIMPKFGSKKDYILTGKS